MSIWSIIFSALASFAGAWLASKWALNSFYRQKVWERKLAAYTAIFDSLHDMNKWFETHLREEETKAVIPEEDLESLRASYKLAQADLRRRMDSDGWLLSTKCRNRVQSLREALEAFNFDGWAELVDHGTAETRNAIRALHTLAREELELNDASFLERILPNKSSAPP